jgi:hypothetical protein
VDLLGQQAHLFAVDVGEAGDAGGAHADRLDRHGIGRGVSEERGSSKVDKAFRVVSMSGGDCRYPAGLALYHR